MVGTVRNEGRYAAQSGVDGIYSVDSSSGYTWGYHLGSGLASGINRSAGAVSGAASGLANIVARYLHFTRPDEGPLRPYEEWPVHFIDRYSDLLVSQKGKLQGAAFALATGVQKAMSLEGVGKNIDFSDFNAGSWRGTLEVQAKTDLIDYNRLATAVAEELRKAPIQPNITVEMEDGDVLIDGESAGRKMAPTISRIMVKTL